MFSHFFDKNNDQSLDYKKKKIFSEEELAFFKHLKQILPNCFIFPQLHLSSIIFAKTDNEKQRNEIEQKIDQHIVDFGIFNENLELLCVIELEDHSKNENELTTDSKTYLNSAKVPSIRWNKHQLPTYDQMLRILAPYSSLTPPKAEATGVATDEINYTKLRAPSIKSNVDHHRIPDHHNQAALSLKFLRDLTPNNFIQLEYPHIWKRICLFAGDPVHLQNYLDSLFLQNRPFKRRGLPVHVANEVMKIQVENNKFTTSEENDSVWGKNDKRI